MVFKKFTDRILSAGTTAANTILHGPEQAERIRQLEAMGFPPERARHALNATGGDVDRAAELLLLGANDERQNAISPPRNNAAGNRNNRNGGNDRYVEGTAVAAHNDEQMRRAMEESMRVGREEEARQVRQVEAAFRGNATREVIDLTGDKKSAAAAKPRKNGAAKTEQNRTIEKTPAKKQLANAVKSAATVNAGKAAAARNNNNNFAAKKTLDQTHPNVQLPEKLSNKSKEDRIMRCAHRLKPHVMAVDTLLRVLTSVRSSPENPKFRTIDRSNANYVAFVRDKPGAEDLLLAMNYWRMTGKDELRLERHMVDDALLYLGTSALEQMRTTPEYIEGKRLRAFHAEMRRVGGRNAEAMQRTGMSEDEASRRSAYLSKCPKEPPEGRGAWVNVQLGDVSENIVGGSVKRRFDGDDTLEDVLNWLGGSYGNEVLDKIRGTRREWCLCDLNRFPILPLDVEKHGKKTLQYLGLFPSGKLGVRLSDDAWRDRKEGSDTSGGFGIHGSARGLGAASRSMLH